MDSLRVPGLTSLPNWLVAPRRASRQADGGVAIEAGPHTDWFIDPRGARVKRDAPLALFEVGRGDFLFTARVQVDFASTFDAGVLMAYVDPDLWAKLCFEFSPQRDPMVVSVVTNGHSDDCNSAIISGAAVFLRIARIGQALAFHFSTEGHEWTMVRHFTLGADAEPEIGLSSQSPTGAGCLSVFSQLNFERRTLGDIRSGE